MKKTIDVSSKEEGSDIEAGLKSTPLRAVTRIVGILEPFKQQERDWIIQRVDDLAGRGTRTMPLKTEPEQHIDAGKGEKPNAPRTIAGSANPPPSASARTASRGSEAD
jgi:hypothetical protein